ncbi:hypothetical protein [Halomarina pelagica]|uniref:hypothetical protein n=1 Tax=Halomarina pelagica TaxID=2961599 RepID=UPI0020C2D2D2|nr:hypothetical protein [Halomarina sp. BND7]
MSSRRTRALVLVVTGLLVFAGVPPVSASHTTLVAEHTTDSDFQQGTTTGFTIEGTGESASLVTEQPVIDDFNDNDLSEYSTVSGDAFVSGGELFLNTCSSGGCRTQYVYSASGDGLSTYFSQGETASIEVDPQEAVAKVGFGYTDIDSGYYIQLNDGANELRIRQNDNGAETTLASTTYDFASAQHRIEIEWQTDGTIIATAYKDGSQVAQVSTTDTTYSGEGIRLEAFSNTGASVPMDNFTLSGGSGEYTSAEYTVENPQTGQVDLTLIDGTATVTWEGYDSGSGSWTSVNSTTYTTSGTKTTDLSAANYDRWRLHIDGVAQPGGTVEIHSEGLTAQTSAPTVDNSTATPSGGAFAQTSNLSIAIDDADFTASSDTVTADWYLDGQLIETTTHTSGGTKSITVDGLTGGTHTWHVELTDTYGHTATSDTFSFTAPATLEVRAERSGDLISNATIDVQFFGDETVYTRSTSDGTVSMTGLPTDERFIVVVESAGWHTRRVIIDSLLDQADVYLLNTSAASVENEFVLEDNTGRYDAENTRLYVKRAVAVTNSSTLGYQTVAGDYFGASGAFPVVLEEDARYRLVIQSEAGDTRVLGTYTANTAGVVPLEVGTLEFTIDETTENATYSYSATYIDDDPETIRVTYVDPKDLTDELTVTVYERNNPSNVLYSTTEQTLGNFSATLPLSASEANTTWMADFEITRGGETKTATVPIGAGKYSPGVPLSPFWKHTISVATLFVVAGLFSRSNAAAGAVILPCLAGVFWFVDWLPAEISALFILIALGLAVIYAHGRSDPIGV